MSSGRPGGWSQTRPDCTTQPPDSANHPCHEVFSRGSDPLRSNRREAPGPVVSDGVRSGEVQTGRSCRSPVRRSVNCPRTIFAHCARNQAGREGKGWNAPGHPGATGRCGLPTRRGTNTPRQERSGSSRSRRGPSRRSHTRRAAGAARWSRRSWAEPRGRSFRQRRSC